MSSVSVRDVFREELEQKFSGLIPNT